MEIYKREGQLGQSAYMKIKGRLRPSGYKSKLGLPSVYKIKGCKEKGGFAELDLIGTIGPVEE